MSVIANKKLRKIVHAIVPPFMRRFLVETVWVNLQMASGFLTVFFSRDPRLWTDLDNGYLRLYLTRHCNARCLFCDHYRLNMEDIDRNNLYNVFRSVYEKVRVVNLVGGEVTIMPETLSFAKFLQKEYPAVTLSMESNAIAFSKEFRELAAKDLWYVHFSINAPDADAYVKHVWLPEEKGGAAAYEKLRSNWESYVALLKEQDKLCFAPSVSMVVTRDNGEDVLPFLKLALKNHARSCGYLFNHRETESTSKIALELRTDHNVVKTLMEVERVLIGRFAVSFRLIMPAYFCDIQREVDAEPLEKLQKKYAEFLELAKDRDMKKEWQQRNEIRRAQGKKTFTFKEDYLPTLHDFDLDGQPICFSPWKLLDLDTTGRAILCSWMQFPFLRFRKFVRNGVLDCDALVNHWTFRKVRYDMLHGKFCCMPMCELNPRMHPVESSLNKHWNHHE